MKFKATLAQVRAVPQASNSYGFLLEAESVEAAEKEAESMIGGFVEGDILTVEQLS